MGMLQLHDDILTDSALCGLSGVVVDFGTI